MDNETQEAGMPEVSPLLIEVEPVETVKLQPKAEAMNNTASTTGSTRAE